jgi:hypothetical protein
VVVGAEDVHLFQDGRCFRMGGASGWAVLQDALFSGWVVFQDERRFRMNTVSG